MALPAKKNRLLYVQRFLTEQTDEEHPATLTDILAYLTGVGISANRKTVMHDIEQLIEAGLDVVCNKGRQYEYFVGDGPLELPELKLLIDAAQASKFLTVKRSHALIDKLLALTSRHQAEALRSGLYLDNHVKPKNESAYITISRLLTGINTNRRVRFKYIEYTPEKKKQYKHGQRVYELSPWEFAWDSDKYYIIGHSKHHNKAISFRVDRIAAPKLTDIPSVPAPVDFDLAAFIKATFSMYDGPKLEVTLKCENALMKTLIDRFGEDVQTEIADAGHFNATVSVSASKTFYGWVFASDGAIRITAPAEAVNAYQDMLGRASQL